MHFNDKDTPSRSNSFFMKVINKVTLVFLDNETEEKFKIQDNLFLLNTQIIALVSLFGFILLALRMLQLYFRTTFDLQINPATGNLNSLLVSFIKLSSYITGEIILYCIPKLKYIRGFIICISFTYEFFQGSYNINLSLNSSSFYCFCLLIPIYFYDIVISIFYCYNWIFGSVNFLITNVIAIVFLCLYPLPYFDRVIYILNFVFMIIISILALRISEFTRRQSFYFMDLATKEKNNTDKILKCLPEPVIIEEKGKLKFANDAFTQLSFQTNLDNQENQLSENSNESEFEKNKYKHIVENINNKEIGKSLNDFIVSSKEISNPTNFIYSNLMTNEQIHFEIISTAVELNHEVQNIYLLKNQTYFKKFQKGKAKSKYSRLFIASVTHNFRTPLNMILGNADLLKERIDIPEIQNFINNIIQGSTMLNLQIEDLLDYSKLLTGAFEPKINPFNLQQIMNQIYEIFHIKFNDRNIMLNITLLQDVPQIIKSDERRIMQILTNLVDNALKFTIQGSVSIIVDTIHDGNLIQIKVKDTGIGIKNDDISKLFDSYGKLDDPQNLNPNGIGMGLYICKKIAEKILGSIKVESIQNIGTTFILEVTNHPYSALNSESPSQNKTHRKHSVLNTPNRNEFSRLNAKQEENNLDFSSQILNPSENTERKQIFECSCPKVLIVDDEFTNRFVLIQFCTKLNMRYQEAKDGKEAFECVQKFCENKSCCQCYKMILMDSNMPFMNGEQSSIAIRSYLNSLNIPSPQIYCVSANSNVFQIVKESKDHIYDKIISKPLSFENFKKEIGFIW